MAYYRPQQSWRDHYNPLRGLSMARIVAMEEAANRGDQADLQWFWNHMHTDVTVSSAIHKRLSHITQLDWDIRAIETADPFLVAEQADVLRYACCLIHPLRIPMGTPLKGLAPVRPTVPRLDASRTNALRPHPPPAINHLADDDH